MKKILLTICIAVLFSGFVSHHTDAFRDLGEIPVQYAGRVKPFESFAREAVLYVTGKPSFQGENPVRSVWAWMTEPEKWNKKAFLKVGPKELKEEFGLAVIEGRISPEILFAHEVYLAELQKALKLQKQKEELSFLDKKRVELYNRASFFRSVGEGTIPGFIPNPEDPMDGWKPLIFIGTSPDPLTWPKGYSPEAIGQIHGSLHLLIGIMRGEGFSREAFEKAVTEFSDALQNLYSSANVLLDKGLLQKEIQYLRLDPFGWGWKLYFLGSFFLLLFLLFKGSGKKKQSNWSWVIPLRVKANSCCSGPLPVRFRTPTISLFGKTFPMPFHRSLYQLPTKFKLSGVSANRIRHFLLR